MQVPSLNKSTIIPGSIRQYILRNISCCRKSTNVEIGDFFVFWGPSPKLRPILSFKGVLFMQIHCLNNSTIIPCSVCQYIQRNISYCRKYTNVETKDFFVIWRLSPKLKPILSFEEVFIMQIRSLNK